MHLLNFPEEVAWRGFKITAAVAAAVAAELLTQVIDLHCKSIHFKIKKSELLRSVADEEACMHTYIHTSTNTY